MRNFRPTLALIVSLVMGVTLLRAESKDEYDAFVNETREAVYGMELPAFAVRTVPERYKDESAVIVAMYYDIDARKKTGFGHLPGTLRFSQKARVEGGELCRMLLLINDRAALEKFSEFDFSTDMKKKMTNAHRRQRQVMGVRVIKPDGEVIDVSTDEFVEVEEGKNGREKRRKLAVPGLEVGDMIDVFFYTEHKLQNVHLDPFNLLLREQYPIMDYQIHAVVDDNLTTQYRTLNGAPDFNISRDEDKNYVLDMHVTDIPAEPQLWYNSAEQSPRVEIHVFNRRSDAYTPPSARKDGLQANPEASTIINDIWAARMGVTYYIARRMVNDNIKNGDKAYKNIGKLLKAGKIDSLEAGDVIYNLLAAAYLVSGDNIYPVIFDSQLLDLLKDTMKGGFVSIVTSDNGEEPLDSLISMYNTTLGQMLGDGKRVYMPLRSIIAPSELHPDFAGRKAQKYYSEKYRKKHPEALNEYFTLRLTTPEDNRNVTSLNVTVDGSTLDVTRRESYLGATKLGLSWLLTDEEIIDAYLAYLSRYDVEVGVKEKSKRAADRAGRYATAAEERVEEFKNELKAYHREAMPEYVDGRVISVGIDPAAPEMIYEIDYRLDGLVRRAGSNMIISVGNLLSGQSEVTGRERERQDDALMAVPREFVTEITIAIPEGYAVGPDALDALNVAVSNEVGTFSSQASVDGGSLKIIVTKRYDVRRIPAAQWLQMLDIIDAAFAWHSQSVIFTRL